MGITSADTIAIIDTVRCSIGVFDRSSHERLLVGFRKIVFELPNVFRGSVKCTLSSELELEQSLSMLPNPLLSNTAKLAILRRNTPPGFSLKKETADSPPGSPHRCLFPDVDACQNNCQRHSWFTVQGNHRFAKTKFFLTPLLGHFASAWAEL
jgi:hypothetical protein